MIPPAIYREPVVVPRGLCSTCAFADECTLRPFDGSPVYRCDELDALRIDVPPATGVTRPTVVRAQARPARLRGLCSNCENRETCTYPRPEHGVWSCDEYA